ncbi:MAG: hypothetical protein IPG16_02605 [Comamonadaceae bacterium]|jgi:hypothetical protein|nr:hypothetical protein [Comamonadaceae bacterium]
MHLISAPTMTQAGIAEWRPSRIAALAETLTPETVETIAYDLERRAYLLVDRVTEEVLVRSFIRNDKVLEQPNVTIAACRAWTAASSAPIRALVVHELKRLQKDAPNARAWHHKDSRPWLETVLASESMGHADALAKASPNPSFNPSPEPSVKPSQEPSK